MLGVRRVERTAKVPQRAFWARSPQNLALDASRSDDLAAGKGRSAGVFSRGGELLRRGVRRLQRL